MTGGRTLLLIAGLVIVGALAFWLRTGYHGDPIASSPTQTASATPTATASPSPTATVAASRSPTASPSSGGRFINSQLEYSIDLIPPWRWSGCLSGSHQTGDDFIAHDTFVTVSEQNETASDTGFHVDTVRVQGRSNPRGLSPRAWYDAGMAGRGAGDDPTDVTFAGRPALRVGERYLVRHEDRMFEVGGYPAVEGGSTPDQRAALISTFKFLSEEELAVIRASPTPSPAPRSAEQVVQVLADGFAKKDVAILATVITPDCMSLGFNQGGGTAMDDQRYLEQLKDRFAKGLTVEVRPNTLSGERDPNLRTRIVQTTWREPGQPDTEVDLMISPEPRDSERWYWRGNVQYGPGGR